MKLIVKQNLFLYITGTFVISNFILYFPDNKHNLAIFIFLNVIFILIAIVISKIKSEKLFSPKNSLILVILLSAALFLYKYGGIKYFNSFIFQDDYPTIYWGTEQGIKMAQQGGVFGWDSNFFGGYYNIVNPTNLAFFVWPFVLILGLRTGLNLFYFLIFIMFSPLVYIYSKNIINDKKINVACLWISFFVLYSFFLNTLRWGNIEVFLSLELLILNLILCELFLKRTKLSSFFLVASLSLTLFGHPIFFLYSLFIILIRILLDKDIRNLIRYVYILFFVFLSILPFIYPLIKYNYYFSINSFDYHLPLNKMFSNTVAYILGPFKNEMILSLKTHLSNWTRTPIVNRVPYMTILSSILPLFLYICLFQKNKFKKSVLSLAIFSLIIEPFAHTETPIIASRSHFVLVILIIFSLGYFIALHHNKTFNLMIIFFIITYCFLFSPGYAFEKIRTVGSIDEYNPVIINEIKKLKGNLILFEQRGSWEYINDPKEGETSERPPYDSHFAPLITKETKKRFFSGAGEGYHYHIDRYNTFICGTYRGKRISDYKIEEFNKLFEKWGIEYLILWSNEAKNYFSMYKDLYEKIWSDDEWAIYRYKDTKPQSLLVKHGHGSVKHEDYYKKDVYLYNVKKGDEVLLKSNHFPAWRAYYNDTEIKLKEKDRQISFFAPETGSYIIRMIFPKYILLSIISIASLFLSFVLSFRGKI